MGMEDSTLRHIEEQKTFRTLILAIAAGCLSVVGGTVYYNTNKHFESSQDAKTHADVARNEADERIEAAYTVLQQAHNTKDGELTQECAQQLANACREKRELLEKPSGILCQHSPSLLKHYLRRAVLTNFTSIDKCKCDTCDKMRTLVDEKD